MIVRKHWETYSGSLTLRTTKYWKGYFLFGVIPLYIAMLRIETPFRTVICGE